VRTFAEEDIDAQIRRAVWRRYMSVRSPITLGLIVVFCTTMMWLRRDDPWAVGIYGIFLTLVVIWSTHLMFKLGYLMGAHDTVNYIENWEYEQGHQ
jgi:hypothetical protein